MDWFPLLRRYQVSTWNRTYKTKTENAAQKNQKSTNTDSKWTKL